MSGKPACRVDDSTKGMCDAGHKCCPHGRQGLNTKGSPNVTINGKPAHRLTDIGTCNCPHGGQFRSIKASKSVTVNGLGLVRINEKTTCDMCGQDGSHVNGSPNVTAGD